MSFLDPSELAALGLAAVGRAVRVSRRAVLHGAARIAIGDGVRIDDFCVLSAGAGGISLGDHVHIGAHGLLVGDGAIRLEACSGLSGRVSVYSASDAYDGEWMTNPTVPAEFRRPTVAPVTIGRHAIVGAGSVIMPGADLGEGAAVGALSFVDAPLPPFGVYAGTPARLIRPRSRRLLALAAQWRQEPGSR